MDQEGKYKQYLCKLYIASKFLLINSVASRKTEHNYFRLLADKDTHQQDNNIP